MTNFAQSEMEAPNEFDPEFYQDWYADLKGFAKEELIRHWHEHGAQEGRIASGKELFQQHGVGSDAASAIDLDLNFYLGYYEDLRKAGIKNKYEAMLHWIKYGQHENRFKNFEHWLDAREGFCAAVFQEIDFSSVISINESYGVKVSYADILECIVGNIAYPVRFFKEDSRNSQFYLSMAVSFYHQFKSGRGHSFLESARTSFNTSVNFKSSVRALELLGNTYLDTGDFNTATAIYRTIINKFNNPGKYVHFLLAMALKEAGDTEAAMVACLDGILANPEFTSRHGELDELTESYVTSKAGVMQSLAVQDMRAELAEQYYNVAKKVYDTYVALFGGNVPECPPAVNQDKILIVGDYHVPQCVRYRIDQKVEQLEGQGKEVTCVDWTQLQQHWNELALHDLVIFYRVPAVPVVLKALAQVNVTGKLSIFEIDDLLFDENYPAGVDTFGGYVGIDTHIELRKGMAQFRTVARFCRYGMASTLPLCEKLKPLVFGDKTILHRNGLDSLNTIEMIDRSKKATVDIFYGSGTQAHNTDFVEQALPAVERILSKYSQARLIVAGYLALPEEFLNRFSEQVRKLPPVNSIKAYWSLLKQADINLAVLHDDEINGCKSELKWFEAACFGTPSVVSSTQNYRDVLVDRQDAYLVLDDESWFTALDALVSNPELRYQVASNALAKVKANYSVAALGQSLVGELARISESTDDRPQTKKKIALVNVFFPPQAIGGATRVVVDNFDILQKHYGDDFELVVFTSDEHCTTPHQLTTYDHKGVRVYRSTVLYRENMDWHPQDPKMYSLFMEFLALEKPDLVHFHCVQRLTGSIVEAARDAKVPYMVTVHDAWWISDHQFLVDGNGTVYPEGHTDLYAPRALPNNVSLGDSIERTTYLKQLLHDAYKVLTVSNSFAEIYRKNGIQEILVNKNGISSTVDWQPKDTSYTKKVVCGHIGGIAEHKGYFLLKKAVEQVQPDNIEMVIVDHSKEEGYEQKAFWGKVPVTFIGRVGQDKIVGLYQSIDVLFAPSTWPESYGLVTREAAACDCWVIASNLGGIGEDIVEDKTGYRVAPEISSIIDMVEYVDSNDGKFKQGIGRSVIRKANEQVKELVEIFK